MIEQTNADLIDNRKKFIKLRDAGHLVQWAAPDKSGSDEAALIRAALNRYELVAIGIFGGTVDGDLYKGWCRTTLVKDWIACKPFVVQLRQSTQTSTYFCEVEKLAKEWASASEKNHV